MKFDLHNHSTYSDGRLDIKGLVSRAKDRGLGGFALTDHDCVFGCDEANEEASKQGLFLLKGLEVSTFYKNEVVHILAFFKDNNPPKEMYDYSHKLIETRINRAKRMLKAIEENYGVSIDYDYILNSGTVITRGNMYQGIIKANPNIDKDYASEMVSTRSKAYIPSSKLDTKDGLKLIHDCGGIAILAHPTLIKREYLREILDLGFEGIEARYPLNKEDEEKYFKALAKEYNLIVTAGSDFHGDTKHADIATSTMTLEELKPLLRLINVEVPNEN